MNGKPIPNALVDAIRAGVIKQPNGVELEASPRAIGGHYIANMPGLTDQRLGELRAAIVRVTEDKHAVGHLQFFAEGGMKVVVKWTAGGGPMSYEGKITAAEHAAALRVDEDTLFTEFVSGLLDDILVLTEQAKRAPVPQKTLLERIAGVGHDVVASLVGRLRANAAAAAPPAPAAPPVLRDAVDTEPEDTMPVIHPADDGNTKEK